MSNRPQPTPERIQEALQHPSWSQVRGTGLDRLESLLEHVPAEVRLLAFSAGLDADPIVPIWRSLAGRGVDTFDLIGLCYGLSHNRISGIHDRAIWKLRRHPDINKLAATAASLRGYTDARLETDWAHDG
jgi:hypothetical protein